MANYYIPVNNVVLEVPYDLYREFVNYTTYQGRYNLFIYAVGCSTVGWDPKCFKVYVRDIRGMSLIRSQHGTYELALKKLKYYESRYDKVSNSKK